MDLLGPGKRQLPSRKKEICICSQLFLLIEDPIGIRIGGSSRNPGTLLASMYMQEGA
jgi:hypothetical protein